MPIRSLVTNGDSRVEGPQKLLAEADRFAMLYNWPGAAPRYTRAESLFAQSGDQKNALAARLGYIWATADSGISLAIGREVAGYMDDALVQANPNFCPKPVLDWNFSNVKGVGAGVFEYRIDFGPGYRIYVGKDGDEIVILLGGSEKKRQAVANRDAHDAWATYKKRKTKANKMEYEWA